MRRLTILSTLIVMGWISQAQNGKPFPVMKTESLTHEFITLPEEIKDKYSLICLASSKESEDELQSWFNPIYNNFIKKPGENDLFSFTYDLNVYFIPMFTGAKRPAYKKVMKKTEQSVNPRMRPHILFFEGTMKHYKEVLQMKNKKIPYFFIVDKQGNIIHTTSGRYTNQKMQEVINSVEPAIKQ